MTSRYLVDGRIHELVFHTDRRPEHYLRSFEGSTNTIQRMFQDKHAIAISEAQAWAVAAAIYKRIEHAVGDGSVRSSARSSSAFRPLAAAEVIDGTIVATARVGESVQDAAVATCAAHHELFADDSDVRECEAAAIEELSRERQRIEMHGFRAWSGYDTPQSSFPRSPRTGARLSPEYLGNGHRVHRGKRLADLSSEGVGSPAKPAFTDWVPHFDSVFEALGGCGRVLEFGLGEGTALFLHRCHAVTSVELDHSGPKRSASGAEGAEGVEEAAGGRLSQSQAWMDTCMSLYAAWPKVAPGSQGGAGEWTPVRHQCSDALSRMSLRSVVANQPPYPISKVGFIGTRATAAALLEVKRMVADTFAGTHIEGRMDEDRMASGGGGGSSGGGDVTAAGFDIAFVDAGVFVRGQIVSELLGLVDIVAAHDCTFWSLYGYDKVPVTESSSDYSRTCFGVDEGNEEAGTCFWVRLNVPRLQPVIEALQRRKESRGR